MIGKTSSGTADHARRPHVVQQNGRLVEIALNHASYHLTRDRCRHTPWHRLQLHVMFITDSLADGRMCAFSAQQRLCR